MNRIQRYAGIFAFLAAALLCACGMPPIPQGPVQPAGNPAAGTRTVEDASVTENWGEFEPDLTPAGAAPEMPGPEPTPGEEALFETPSSLTKISPNQEPEPGSEGDQDNDQAGTGEAEDRPLVELAKGAEDPAPEATSQPDLGRPAGLVPQPTASGLADCAEKGPGREKVRVVNKTGEGAILYLYGPENYACAIPPGVQRIYIRGGVYNLSSRMCGGQQFDLGNNVVNPTWYITLRCPSTTG
jgi:hypothetical protein